MIRGSASGPKSVQITDEIGRTTTVGFLGRSGRTGRHLRFVRCFATCRCNPQNSYADAFTYNQIPTQDLVFRCIRSFSRLRSRVMRFEIAVSSVIGLLAIGAGCQHSGGYANRCPHCHQVHSVADAHTTTSSSPISPVGYNATLPDLAPVPKFTSTRVAPSGLSPVPPIPAAEE